MLEAAHKRDQENAAKHAAAANTAAPAVAKHDWTHHFKTARDTPAAFRAAKPDPFASPLSATPSAVGGTPPRGSPLRSAGTPGDVGLGAFCSASTHTSPPAMPFGPGAGCYGDGPASESGFGMIDHGLHLLEEMPVGGPPSPRSMRRASVPNLSLHGYDLGSCGRGGAAPRGAAGRFGGAPRHQPFRTGIDIGAATRAAQLAAPPQRTASHSASLSQSHLGGCDSPPSVKHAPVMTPFEAGGQAHAAYPPRSCLLYTSPSPRD